ncbi:MAG: 23S rRNA (adenine(2503)-C2)-methyltransferase, partial [Chloroflexi bacterium]|nr:23S rRNA (adenine(2503)-C2)-methyltransferase [Chloroflexota bacterium]
MPAPSDNATAGLPCILDLSKEELSARLREMGEPSFRARQVWRALYHEARSTFDEMTNVSKTLRVRLAAEHRIDPLEPGVTSRSREGSTEKTLFRLADGEVVEAVLMRYDADSHRRRRRTACISTQAGCTLACTFCATGQQGLVRNLTVGEIVGQVLHMIRVTRAEDAADVAGGSARRGEIPSTGVTNVVLMGMGEPFANYENTLAAIRVLNDEAG